MLQIKHIIGGYATNILFEDTQIMLYPNVINGIIGKSGIGKSTLLYIIGLLNFDIRFEYLWDGLPIEKKSLCERADIRREEIGYLMQDKELISDQLSLHENILCMYAFTSRSFKDDEIMALQRLLRLETVDFKRYPKSLSGGERQRFALLLALLKKPKLLLCDEPTSALDKKNRMIFIEILKQLAKSGVMVVVASHDEHIIQAMDVVYEIKNRKINLIKSPQLNENDELIRNHHHRKGIRSSFYKVYNKRMKEKYALIANIVIVFIFCFISLLPFVFDRQTKLYEQQMNDVSVKEALVVNTQSHLPNPQYLHTAESFSQDDLLMMHELDHLEKILNFYQLYPIMGTEITINQNQTSMVHEKNTFVIQPMISENKQIEISKEAASALSIIEDDSISFSAYTDDNNVDKIPCTFDHLQVQTDQHNPYDKEQKVIYVPYEYLDRILTDNQQKASAKAVLIEVDSIENMEDVMNEIMKWFPGKSILYNLKNIEVQLTSIKTMKQYLRLSYYACLAIVIVYVLVSESISMKKRAHEFNNLMINGIQKKQLYYLCNYEKIKVILSMLGGLPLLWIMGYCMKFTMVPLLQMSVVYVLLLFVYGFVLILIAGLVIKKAITSDNLSAIMRN